VQEEAATGAEPQVPQQIALSALEQEVFAALSERNTKLADMYLGGLAVFQQAGNPDRVALSAHDFRELMEKAPQYLDLSITSKSRPSLNQTVIDYANKWDGCKRKSQNHCDGKWQGEIDGHLGQFLQHTETFVRFYKDTHGAFSRNDIRKIEYFFPTPKFIPFWSAALSAVTKSW